MYVKPLVLLFLPMKMLEICWVCVCQCLCTSVHMH